MTAPPPPPSPRSVLRKAVSLPMRVWYVCGGAEGELWSFGINTEGPLGTGIFGGDSKDTGPYNVRLDAIPVDVIAGTSVSYVLGNGTSCRLLRMP